MTKIERMARDFRDSVENRFEFLVLEYMYSGPFGEETEVYFVNRESLTRINILYMLSEGYIAIKLHRFVEGSDYRIDLRKSYVLTGLGPIQHVRDRTTTPAGIDAAVESMAVATRKIMPLVEGPDGDQIFLGVYKPPRKGGHRAGKK